MAKTKKRHRLRKILLLGAGVGALLRWREKKLNENSERFAPR